jgi:hypothetical protein
MLKRIQLTLNIFSLFLILLPQVTRAQSLAALPGGRTFIGSIDYYPVVAHVAIQGKSVKGHYFYLKRGKPLDLSGTYEASTGKWKITESVSGKPTGYFEVNLTMDEILGDWSAKSDLSDPKEVTLNEVEIKAYDPSGVQALRIGGRYATTHNIMMYDGENEEGDPVEHEEEVTDDLYVRGLGSGVFAYYISVLGTNAHTGEVSGLGEMTNATTGKSSNSDCALTFDFSKAGEVSVTEVDCEDYHGARVTFDQTFTKR